MTKKLLIGDANGRATCYRAAGTVAFIPETLRNWGRATAAVERVETQYRASSAKPAVKDLRPDVLIIHASDTKDGGILSASLFYASALIAAGYQAEIWTASKGLTTRAKRLGIPVYYNWWLKNAGFALLHPALIVKALRARRSAISAIHQGEKLWLFGRLWLSGLDESVVFHNDKIGQRRHFRRWLALSERHRATLEDYRQQNKLRREIRSIRNGPLPDASIPAQRPAKPDSHHWLHQ